MIRDVTESLLSLIHRETPDLGEWASAVSLHEGATIPTNQLAVFLYRIGEQAHSRNRPMEFDGERYRRPPMMVQLHYLMAWFGADGVDAHLDEQARLDRLIQVFHSHPIVEASDLPAALADNVDRLAIRMWSPTDEERNEIWTGVRRPMRLSLFYQVEAIPITPTTRGGPPITEQQIEYGEWART